MMYGSVFLGQPGVLFIDRKQKRQRTVRMRPLLLPAFLAFTAAVLPPNASIGQDAGFGRDADVHVREDSFACKETSELDRLLHALVRP